MNIAFLSSVRAHEECVLPLELSITIAPRLPLELSVTTAPTYDPALCKLFYFLLFFFFFCQLGDSATFFMGLSPQLPTEARPLLLEALILWWLTPRGTVSPVVPEWLWLSSLPLS